MNFSAIEFLRKDTSFVFELTSPEDRASSFCDVGRDFCMSPQPPA